MRRRTLLGGLLASGLASSAEAADSAPPPRVIVVGAGPAGITAALELAERGALVTLVEAAGQVGGKGKGWVEVLDGVEVDVEAGAHGLFAGDVNTLDLLGRYALEGGLVRLGRAHAGVRRLSGDDEPLRGFTGKVRPDALDAATRARFFAEPTDLDPSAVEEARARRVAWAFRGNPQTLMWEPLLQAFRHHKGKVRLDTRVKALILKEGHVLGVRAGEEERTFEIPVPTAWTRIDAEDDTVYVGPDGAGGFRVLDARCTHAGCPVDLAPDGFACPCHGGRYDPEGTPVSGPPPKPLRQGRWTLDGDRLTVVLGGTVQEIRGHAVVLAVDAPAAARLCRVFLPETARLRAAGTRVARFWFDRDVAPSEHTMLVVDEPGPVVAVRLLHRIHDGARQWAEHAGGSVIEVHAVPLQVDASVELDALEASVRALWPGLSGASVRKRTLARGSEATWFYPGWTDAAMEVSTGIPGLYAAGDHVRGAGRSGIEGAVRTGRMAAAAIASAHGLRPVLVLG